MPSQAVRPAGPALTEEEWAEVTEIPWPRLFEHFLTFCVIGCSQAACFKTTVSILFVYAKSYTRLCFETSSSFLKTLETTSLCWRVLAAEIRSPPKVLRWFIAHATCSMG